MKSIVQHLKKLLPGQNQRNNSGEANGSDFIENGFSLPRDFHLGRRITILIDSDRIYLAMGCSRGGKPKLEQLSSVAISEVLQTEEQKREFITQTVRNFVNTYGGSAPRISLLLGGKATTYRTFSLPAMTGAQLQSAIEFEVKKQLPFPIDECYYDYTRQVRTQRGDIKRDTIAVHAATRLTIKELLEPFADLKTRINSIVFAPSVIGQLMAANDQIDPDQTVAIIGIYSDRSEISFFRQGRLEFYRTGNSGIGQTGESDDEIRLLYYAESLAAEIQTSFDYYSGQFGRSLSNQIFIYGNICNPERLTEMLSQTSSYECQLLPVDSISRTKAARVLSETDLRSCLTVAAAATSTVEYPSLLPHQQKKVFKQCQWKSRARLSLGIVSVALALSWLHIDQSSHLQQEQLQQLNQQLSHLQSSEAYVTYQLLKRQIAAGQEYVAQAKETPSHFHFNLKELSVLTPSNIRLQRLLFDPVVIQANMIVDGTIWGSTIPPEITLAEYIESLNASPFYRNVTIKRHAKRKENKVFTIDFSLAMDGGI